jgi:hypothetical protein
MRSGNWAGFPTFRENFQALADQAVREELDPRMELDQLQFRYLPQPCCEL